MRPNARRFDVPLVFGQKVVWPRVLAVAGRSSRPRVEEVVGPQAGCSRRRHRGWNLAALAAVDGASHGQPAEAGRTPSFPTPSRLWLLRRLPLARRMAAAVTSEPLSAITLRRVPFACPSRLATSWWQVRLRIARVTYLPWTPSMTRVVTSPRVRALRLNRAIAS